MPIWPNSLKKNRNNKAGFKLKHSEREAAAIHAPKNCLED